LHLADAADGDNDVAVVGIAMDLIGVDVRNQLEELSLGVGPEGA
jgi:hypothetical protein